MALYFTSRAHNRVVYYRYHTSVHRRAYNRAGSGFDTVSIDARNSLLRTLCVGSVAAVVIDTGYDMRTCFITVDIGIL